MNQSVRRELRQFGFLVGGIFVVIGLWPLVFEGKPMRSWVVALGGILVVLATIRPHILGPVHRGWIWVGHVLGWINTRILLGIVFYGLITPIGVIFRLMGKDTMRQVFAKESSTYRIPKTPRPRSHMKYQF